MIHYIILAHKNPEQVQLLVNALSYEKNKIYIHIDGYSDISLFQNITGATLIKKRSKIRWGGFSMVEATLNSFGEIPNLGHNDHVVVMSGQDFPIASQDKINSFLSQHIGKSFLEYRIQPNEEWNILNRVVKYHFHDLIIPEWIDNFLKKIISIKFDISNLRNQIFPYIFQRIVNFLLPNKTYLIKNYEIYWGAQWQAISGKHIQYILDFCASGKGKDIKKAFRTTAGPDEIFFQTVLLNSPYKGDMINDLLWYIDWWKGPGRPRILDISDINSIRNSGKLFARKFELDISKELIDNLLSTIHE